jgi:hypothetical protein
MLLLLLLLPAVDFLLLLDWFFDDFGSIEERVVMLLDLEVLKALMLKFELLLLSLILLLLFQVVSLISLFLLKF